MGLINSALHIGRSAITSYQGALSIIGNNIANAADPDYTRQRAVLDPATGAPLPSGIQPGGGVTLTSLQRIINEALEDRVRLALGDVNSALAESSILGQIEAGFNELTDSDLSTLMSNMFNSFQDVQNNPTDVALRSVAIGNATALTDALRAQRRSLEGIVEEINGQIDSSIVRADELASDIADLNVRVVQAEAAGQIAGALRDQRDAALRELAEIIEITVRIQESGTVSVFVGNETLVQFGNSRGLTTRTVVEGDMVRSEVVFADGSGEAEIRGGTIEGLIQARDTHIGQIITQLDQLAAGLIEVVNQVHSNGQGLEGFATLTGSVSVLDPDVPLNDAAAGLLQPPRTGSFFISVTDTSGSQIASHQIEIDLDGQGGDDTTLSSLVDLINGTVSNVTAGITVDNRLTLTAQAGFTFTFGHDGVSGRDDSADVLAALGVNTFFQGQDASDVAVNETVVAQPELIAASSVPVVGDGANAAALADAGSNVSTSLGGSNPFEFYNRLIAQLGVTTASAATRTDSAQSAANALQQQRASLSGVNLDEEAIELLRFERAFQGSARFTTVIDQLIGELLAIVR